MGLIATQVLTGINYLSFCLLSQAIAFIDIKEAIALNYYDWLRISSFPGSCLGMYDG